MKKATRCHLYHGLAINNYPVLDLCYTGSQHRADLQSSTHMRLLWLACSLIGPSVPPRPFARTLVAVAASSIAVDGLCRPLPTTARRLFLFTL